MTEPVPATPTHIEVVTDKQTSTLLTSINWRQVGTIVVSICTFLGIFGGWLNSHLSAIPENMTKLPPPTVININGGKVDKQAVERTLDEVLKDIQRLRQEAADIQAKKGNQ